MEFNQFYSLDVSALSPEPSDFKAIKANKLGQGSYGEVYRGEYQGAPVAVKRIHDDIIAEDDSAHVLQQECQVMMQLHHPNVGRLYGFNLSRGSACMVMELAELGSLYDILKNKTQYPTLSWKRRLSIAMDIVKGLMCLHDRSSPILHRDLKSLNVLIRQYWSAFIADFGLARMKLNSESVGTKGIGSAPWMAPEMTEASSVPTVAIDIFSFGMILYELMTREIPFGLEKFNSAQICISISRGKRPMIPENEGMKEVPEGYQELMMECWDQDPLKRPTLKNVLARLKKMDEVTPALPDGLGSLQGFRGGSDADSKLLSVSGSKVGNVSGSGSGFVYNPQTSSQEGFVVQSSLVTLTPQKEDVASADSSLKIEPLETAPLSQRINTNYRVDARLSGLLVVLAICAFGCWLIATVFYWLVKRPCLSISIFGEDCYVYDGVHDNCCPPNFTVGCCDPVYNATVNFGYTGDTFHSAPYTLMLPLILGALGVSSLGWLAHTIIICWWFHWLWGGCCLQTCASCCDVEKDCCLNKRKIVGEYCVRGCCCGLCGIRFWLRVDVFCRMLAIVFGTLPLASWNSNSSIRAYKTTLGLEDSYGPKFAYIAIVLECLCMMIDIILLCRRSTPQKSV